MIPRKIIYSKIALSKRKAIKKDIKAKYGSERADKFSKHISKTIAELKQFPEMGISMREKYEIDCDYYMLFIEHNYFIYRILENVIMILEIFNEKEDFMYQLFGIVTTSQDTLDHTKDIAYYAKDSRLTESSDGKRYEWRKMIELSKELGSS